MAPGLLLDDADQEKLQSQGPLLSKLEGPELVVRHDSALEFIRESFEQYSEHLAVASLYQPGTYLQEIFKDGPPSLPRDASKTHLRWSFAQLKHAGELLAAAFAARGVREGMTIASFAKGSIEFYMILYAALVLRCRFSPMNPAATANAVEATSMLQAVDADVVVTMDAETLERLETTMPEVTSKLLLKISVPEPSAAQKQARWLHLEELVVSALPFSSAKAILEPFEQIQTHPDDNVYILFTSGTSSLPKACPLTHRNLCAIATNFSNGPTGGPGAVVCNHLPIYHIAGGISAGWNPLNSGAAAVHPAPAFTSSSTLEAMRVEGVTFMVLVPSMLGLIADDPALPPPGQISIKSCSLGASTILYTDVEKCYALLGAQRVITSYGMTEGLMMTRGHLPREVTKAALNGIQAISAGARLKICAPNSRTILPRGEAGEVHQGGATTIRGYLGRKSDAFYEDEDGIWCMTGDQAIMHPDGGVQVTGRYKDIIIRGGVNISPSSIEGVIAKILKIEAHVVGMPDSIAGEVPVAIVRTSDVGKASAQKLREPIVRELGPKFALEKFITLEELGFKDFPMTSTRKVRKVDLQAAVKQYAIQKQGEKEQKQISGGGDTLSRLMEIWSDVAGLALEELKPESSVQDLADSLMLSRFANTVKKAFSRPFTLDDLTKHPTLGAQATLLDSRLEPESSNADLESDRTGPPQPEDMVHCEDDEEIALHTKMQCDRVLKKMGFVWDDVQDVCTPTQWLQSWVKSRETSDRFRASYITNEADVSTLASAIEETLRRNDSIRAISLPYGDGTDIQMIMRHTPKWVSKVITIREEPVEKIADLEGLIPGDFKLNHGLAQVVIAHCKETGTAGAALMTLHTTFDAFSLDILRKDMNTILNKSKPQQHVPYKLWADHLYNQRESKQSQTAIKFNVKRLSGLATHRAALWPPQRTPVWQRGCDRGLHITPNGQVTHADDPEQRPLLDGPPELCIGSTGLRRQRALEDITILTAKHRIPPPVIVKAALALLETRQTGQSTALFSQTFAMRDNWPFIDGWVSRRLPSPLEVTGPCLSRIAEVIPVDGEENVMDWLQRLKAEQEILVKHAHAPYREVFDSLNRNSEEQLDHLANGHTNGHTNGYTNGITNGHTNGHTNGYTNGYTNGHTNGHTNGYTNGVTQNDVSKPYVNGHHRSQSSTQSNGTTNGASSARTRGYTTGHTNGYTNGHTNGLSNGFTKSFANGNANGHVNGHANDFTDEHAPAVQEVNLLPTARDGDVMESIRKRINFQWLPIFGNGKGVKPQVRVASSSHFNEVGLAVKSGMLADHKTVWVKMEWDDGNIRKSEAKAWIEEMIQTVEILGKEENWSKKVKDLY